MTTIKIQGGFLVVFETGNESNEYIREVRDSVGFNFNTDDEVTFTFNVPQQTGDWKVFKLGADNNLFAFADLIDDRTGVAFPSVDDLKDFLSLNLGFFGDASIISGYNLIQEEGVDITKRQTINFIGDNVLVEDDAGNLVTKVTIDSDKLPGNYQVIDTESDFTVSGGKNTLDDTIVYLFNSGITLTRPFDISNIASASYLIGRSIVLYSGTGALFQGTGFTGAFEINDVGILDLSGSQTLFDLTGGGGAAVGNAFIARRCTFIGFASKGEVKDIGGGVVFNSFQFSNCGTGLKLTDCAFLDLNVLIDNSAGTTNSPQFSIAGTFGDIDIMSTRLEMNAGESFLQIASNTVFSRIDLGGIPYSKADGGEFLASAKSGAITAFASDSGESIVTSAVHGLSIEQYVTITGTTNYNGTWIVSKVTTNTFNINKPFTVDDATGNFTTGDSNDFLDDNDFESFTNGDQKNSNEIGIISINNTITTTIALAATPVKLTGLGSDWTEDRSRRTEYDTLKPGVVIYKSTKDQECILHANISTSVVSGGAKLMKAYIAINDVIIPSSVDQIESNRIVTLQPRTVQELTEDDEVSVYLENFDDTTNLQSEVGAITLTSKK